MLFRSLGERVKGLHHAFRRRFAPERPVASAKLYVCGLGHFRACLNGAEVTDAVLETGWTHYDKTCQYSAYDVTALVRQGENALGILPGDGMFNVTDEGYAYYPRSYGLPRFIARLRLAYEDGGREDISSGEGWEMAPGPILYSGIYGGEDYDARLEPDWTGEAGWEPATASEPPKGRLEPQLQEPLKVTEILPPASVRRLSDGVWLYDLGSNFSGWASLEMAFSEDPEGREISMIPSELLGADGRPDQRGRGAGYHWRYIASAAPAQRWRPSFTYYGFRYVMVEGAVPAGESPTGAEKGLPVIRRLQGEFITPDNLPAGGFECSEELFNQIHRLVYRAMLSNIKSYMTDCPHREKLPWLEQTHLIGPGMLYSFNLRNLYEKIERDMADSQRESGLVPDICPEYVVFGYHEGFVDSPEWGSACILNAWHLYRMYGDNALFGPYYPLMRRYILYLKGKTYGHLLHHGLGDWLDIGPMKPYSQNTPVAVVASAMYYYDLRIMAEIAGILAGEAADPARAAALRADREEYLAEMAAVSREYNAHFFDDQTNRYATGSQAAQAMSLIAGLVPEDRVEKVLHVLVEDIEKRGYATTAGDVGHPFVLAALTRWGRSDVIVKMTRVTDRPGYGYQVKCGATTLTEDWDGPDPANPHNSQNHLMLGGIMEWFYGGLAGIHSLRAEREGDQILFKPHFAEGIDRVDAWTTLARGRAALSWRRLDGERVRVTITVPPNARAVFENERDGGRAEYPSGTHSFEID